MIDITPNLFKITLYNRGYFGIEQVSKDVSKQSIILNYIIKNSSINSREVERLFGIQSSGARKILRKMTDDGLLMKDESSKPYIYRLNK